ncbi:MAG: hypothetical protein LBI77_01000 [Puniceicoccales bacterium]|nr:hypothetical protein [Puniceicoccales bacterium]
MRDRLALQLVGRHWLSEPDSPKEAFQLSFEHISGENFDYQCGDSLAVWPENPPEEVERILAHFAMEGQQKIDGIALSDWLRNQRCIAHLSDAFLESVRGQLGGEELEKFAAHGEAFGTASLCDVIDLFPSLKFRAETLLPLLKKMQPRLYSIASAVSLQPKRLDLAIVVVKYKNFRNRDRYGVASHYLCHRLPLYKQTATFIAHSRFKLPQDISRDVIMVGPGTGIAPFRSFLQERAALRKAGKSVGENWLFFGEQHRASNFYYADELAHWQASGNLIHLDLAFSRDQEYKIYVQDRMRERGQELWKWLDRGAYFYVCGDAAHMAKDVEIALLDIIHQWGAMDAPLDFLKQLKKENRYQRDVY